MATSIRTISRSSTFDLATSPIDTEFDHHFGYDSDGSASDFLHSTTPLSQNDIDPRSGLGLLRSRADQDLIIDCVIERLNEYAKQQSPVDEEARPALRRVGRGVRSLRSLGQDALRKEYQKVASKKSKDMTSTVQSNSEHKYTLCIR